MNMNFIAAENLALQTAYEQFFGKEKPGVAFAIIDAAKTGNPFTEREKFITRQIAQQTISRLTKENLTKLICEGVVPDCRMSRSFMSTGVGYNWK